METLRAGFTINVDLCATGSAMPQLDRVIANMRAAEGDTLPPLATGAASAGRGAADS